MEKAETEEGSFLDCFRGTNLRRTEIVSLSSALARYQIKTPAALPPALIQTTVA